MLDLRAYDPETKQEIIFTDVLAFIRHKLGQMEASLGEPEKLRLFADDVYQQALQAIAEGHPRPAEIAQLALETRRYQPSRYFGFGV